MDRQDFGVMGRMLPKVPCLGRTASGAGVMQESILPGRDFWDSADMHFRVFYLINRSGECVSSTSAVAMSAKAICEQMLDRLQSEDDYLGILDAGDNTLQVLPEPSKQRYYVEVPIDAAKASYGRYVDRAELEQLVRSLPPNFDERSIPGLSYRPW
jgi:hypothetical protein